MHLLACRVRVTVCYSGLCCCKLCDVSPALINTSSRFRKSLSMSRTEKHNRRLYEVLFLVEDVYLYPLANEPFLAPTVLVEENPEQPQLGIDVEVEHRNAVVVGFELGHARSEVAADVLEAFPGSSPHEEVAGLVPGGVPLSQGAGGSHAVVCREEVNISRVGGLSPD